MRKVFKNRIFIVIITMIICISGTLYGATQYNASNVLYNPSNGDSMTVNEALNELYNKYNGDSDITYPVSFAEDSWETIMENIKAGNASAYRVGDTKEIELTGFTNEKTGSNGLYTIRIANTSTPEECSTDGFSQTACGIVIEFVDIITKHNMNTSATNVGGWKDSELRDYVNDTIYNALPEELRKNIINTYVVSSRGSSDTSNFTTNDKIYLLSTEEVWAGKNQFDTAAANTRQLDYYKNNNITTSNYSGAIKKYNGSSDFWWLRSACSYFNNYFYFVDSIGNGWDDFTRVATHSNGVAIAFRIR